MNRPVKTSSDVDESILDDKDTNKEGELLSPDDKYEAEQWYIKEDEWDAMKKTQQQILAAIQSGTLRFGQTKRKPPDAGDDDNGDGDAPKAKKPKTNSEGSADDYIDIAIAELVAASSKEKCDCQDKNEVLDDDISSQMSQTLKDLEQEYNSNEERGPKIKESVAKILNKLSEGRLSDEKVKEKIDKYQVPENFNGAKVPKVNSEI